MPMKFLWLLTLFSLGFSPCFSQNNAITYSLELKSALAYKNTLPFWMTANKFGAVPNSNHNSVYAALFSDFKNSERGLSFSYKASFTGYLASKNDLFINELYGSLKFKGAQLVLGSKNDDILYEGLSASNGDIIKSANTRAFPGINLKTDGYIKLPIAKKWLRVKAHYAEYLLNDKRIVDGAHLHHKRLHFKSILSEKFSMVTGMDHYVQWGGTSAENGNFPSTFKDYIRVLIGYSGGESALDGDKINALGNHVGSYLFQLNYTGEKTNWNLYWSHPFEDRSGRELTNSSDALYGFFIDLKKPEKFVTHILAEVTYTKSMSGSNGFSGRDNYFNNSYYGSGWTYFGRTIGSPFFPVKPEVNGITHGVLVGYNRFISYNIGVKGFVNSAIQYKTNLSYTMYEGWFNDPINKEQFSSLLEISFSPKRIPFEISVGTAADFGNFLPQNIGGFFKLTKTMNN